jgi:hypothetical protein
LGGLLAAVAAVGLVVALAADMGEEAEEEMGRVLVVVKEEDRPPLLLLTRPVAADETRRVQACPMALAAAAMVAGCVCCCVGGDLWLLNEMLCWWGGKDRGRRPGRPASRQLRTEKAHALTHTRRRRAPASLCALCLTKAKATSLIECDPASSSKAFSLSTCTNTYTTTRALPPSPP